MQLRAKCSPGDTIKAGAKVAETELGGDDPQAERKGGKGQVKRSSATWKPRGRRPRAATRHQGGGAGTRVHVGCLVPRTRRGFQVDRRWAARPGGKAVLPTGAQVGRRGSLLICTNLPRRGTRKAGQSDNDNNSF